MNEFESIFGDEFFIIDSHYLQDVNQEFYGYAIQDNKLIQRENINNDLELYGDGSYVWVKVDSEHITILQDYVGSYGLYLYQFNDNFVISNSFVKLVDYLKMNFKYMSFDKKFADAFIFSDVVSNGYDKTLVNEIQLVPRDYKIIINKEQKDIDFEFIDYKEQSVPLNSKEGFEILDNWYFKWVDVLRSLKSKTNNIEFDLSGGFDSRVSASIWLTAGIDLNKVIIKSITHERHADDFRIASEIANEFNFVLNNYSLRQNPIPFKELDTILNISFYTKLGFHKQWHFQFNRYDEPIYNMGGSGGEGIRGYYNYTPEGYVEHIVDETRLYSKELVPATEEIIRYSCEKLKHKFNLYDENSYDLAARLYMENMNRHHFGRDLVENYCSNVVKVSPILDSALQKLIIQSEDCMDRDLLIALIYYRYCPKLLDFDFENGREINKDTIEFAKKLSDSYPLNVKQFELVSGPDISTRASNPLDYQSLPHNAPLDFLKEVFCSRFFEMEFKKYYSDDIYRTILTYVLDSNHPHPLTYAYCAFAIIKIIHDTRYKFINNNAPAVEWIKGFLNGEKMECIPINISDALLKYGTARIDIKNEGSKYNSIEVISNTDIQSKENYPLWFKSDSKGDGLVITSLKGSLDLKIKCINEGLLKIWLRGLDVRDRNEVRFPIYIDYFNFSINDEELISDHSLFCHDEPFLFQKEVSDQEIINIHIEWMPFNYSSVYNPH